MSRAHRKECPQGYENRDKLGYQALTKREQEIFFYAVRGKTSVEIGKLLFISPKTVESHRTRINRVIGVHSPQELVLYALRNGYLTKENLDHLDCGYCGKIGGHSIDCPQLGISS